jgi:hypothetical protein
MMRKVFIVDACLHMCFSVNTLLIYNSFVSPDFFDQFEQQTQGENFVRDPDATQKSGTSGAANEKASVQQNNDKDDINDFFDEFEKTTRGENFKREG